MDMRPTPADSDPFAEKSFLVFWEPQSIGAWARTRPQLAQGAVPMRSAISVGNVCETTPAEIYREHPLFISLRDSDALGGKCGECEFRTICGGSRPAAAICAASIVTQTAMAARHPNELEWELRRQRSCRLSNPLAAPVRRRTADPPALFFHLVDLATEAGLKLTISTNGTLIGELAGHGRVVYGPAGFKLLANI